MHLVTSAGFLEHMDFHMFHSFLGGETHYSIHTEPTAWSPCYADQIQKIPNIFCWQNQPFNGLCGLDRLF